jgi:hypothetical protein
MVAGRWLGLFVAGGTALAATPPAAPLPRPRAPRTHLWTRVGVNAQRCVIWRRGPLTVLSSCSSMDLPDGSGEQGPTWLVSITRAGERASDREVARMLRDFGMLDAEEDNHTPGTSRAFFLVVDPSRRVDCECKATETVIVEKDGYRWSNPSDGPCRGCELEQIAGPERRCPIHGGAS